MGNKQTKKRNVVNRDFFKRIDTCGQLIKINNPEDNIYLIKSENEKLVDKSLVVVGDSLLKLNFKTKKATLNDEIVKNIFLHKYNNIIDKEIFCFLVEYKESYKFYCIRELVLYSTFFEIEKEKIEEFTLHELVKMSLPDFGVGDFKVDQEKLSQVTVNTNIQR